MKNDVFRQKSLDRVNSPEDINNYLKVTNPPVWFIMGAVILLLAGAIVWACVAKIETKTSGVVVADKQYTSCYVSESKIGYVKPGTIVRINGNEYTVSGVSDTPAAAELLLSPYCISLGGFELGENVYKLNLSDKIKPRNYACTIVLESISPITFLTKSSSRGNE